MCAAVLCKERKNRMNWIEGLREDFIRTFIRDDRYKVFVTGFQNTILITLVSLVE